MEVSSPPPQRWWKRLPVRLSLRALMALVVVVGCGLGWKANRARNQRRAVEAIKAVGGNVVYDFQYTGDEAITPKFNPAKEPPAPRWLRAALGDEYFQEVTVVDLRKPAAGTVLAAISDLDHLVNLSLDGSKLDDSALGRIARLPRLRRLEVSQGSVTDSMLANLAGARKLRTIGIHGAAGVTDAGLAYLAGLPELRSVTIFAAPKLTDRGLKNLGPRLAELETLALFRTAVTDEGMAYLEGCRNLKVLSLPGARIGDAGLAHFRNLDSLAALVVNSTDVTDEGLVQIRNLKGLKSLVLQGTRVSAQAIAALQADRPSLRIASGPAVPVRSVPAPTAPSATKGTP